MENILEKVKKIHFVGIGGIGMSGIAEILINWGFQISGSDLVSSENTERLEKLGAKIYIGHNDENINSSDLVVYSSAVKGDNIEIIEALRKNIPIVRRAKILAEIERQKSISIAVSGTHGKTTTTAIIGNILIENRDDPTIIAGGILKEIHSPARSGNGKHIVIEADEFDRSFLELTPTFEIITTIEIEHLDCYKSIKELEDTFIQFANKTPSSGKIIACFDEPNIRNIIPHIERKVITYGLSPDSEFKAGNIKFKTGGSSFSVIAHNSNMGNVDLNVPGIHNIKNALAAIATCIEQGVSFNIIRKALAKFQGVKRRFDIVFDNDDYILVDDYAHHPTEIEATLNAAKSGWNRRIIAVFQPHLYSRTSDFYREFAKSLLAADIIIITDIYPAREKPIEGISGKLIADTAINLEHSNVNYVKNKDDIPKLVLKLLNPGDMVITLGAGDIWTVNEYLKKTFEAPGSAEF